jgi:hypothetical protein
MLAHEERPKGSWVVAFFPTNAHKNYSDVRLFPSMDMALLRYAKSTRTLVIYSNAGEMAHRHSPKTLTKYINDIYAQFDDPYWRYKTAELGDKILVPPDNLDQFSKTELADELWEICQIVGDQCRGSAQISDSNEDMYKIRIDRMTSEEGKAIWSKFPKQARQIIEALIRNGKSVMAEDDLQRLVIKLVADRVMKTKQDPWRIFCYYAPMIGDHRMLYYPGKRNKVEDHSENL